MAKTGGLADVVSALTVFLHAEGHDIRALMPFHSTIDTSRLDVTPVDFLQDRHLWLGRHHYRYSIDPATARHGSRGDEIDVYRLSATEQFPWPE